MRQFRLAHNMLIDEREGRRLIKLNTVFHKYAQVINRPLTPTLSPRSGGRGGR
jgi:hypothetical protein